METQAGLPKPPALSEWLAKSPIALFLDFDGTLVDLAETPDGVIVPPHLTSGLQSLSQRLEARLAIVTGRPLFALDAFLGPNHITAVGSHGGEYRGAPTPPPPLSAKSLEALAQFTAARPNLIIEHKPYGVAVHYRQQPEAASSVYQLLEKIAEDENLAVKTGKMLVEIGPALFQKGAAVERLMSQPPFRGACPIFIGDDVTDEDGFRAAKAAGGHGILVGPIRQTSADFHLPRTGDVLRWCQINET